MKKLLLAAGVVAMAVTGPAAATAKKPSPRAKHFSATLSPTAADMAAYSAVTGKAKLVDNKKRDTVSLHMRNLGKPGTKYTWSVRKVTGDATKPCAADTTSEAVTAFKYRRLKANKSGNGNSGAKSRTFKAEAGATYIVQVVNADGFTEACGAFKAKKAPKGSPKPAKQHPGKHDPNKGS